MNMKQPSIGLRYLLTNPYTRTTSKQKQTVYCQIILITKQQIGYSDATPRSLKAMSELL